VLIAGAPVVLDGTTLDGTALEAAALEVIDDTGAELVGPLPTDTQT
jgi:hypothetical protein